MSWLRSAVVLVNKDLNLIVLLLRLVMGDVDLGILCLDSGGREWSLLGCRLLDDCLLVSVLSGIVRDFVDFETFGLLVICECGILAQSMIEPD